MNKQILFILIIIISVAVSPLKAEKISNFLAKGYDSHVELRWENIKKGSNIEYRIYASVDKGKTFVERGKTGKIFYLDFVTDLGRNISLIYQIKAFEKNKAVARSNKLDAKTRDFSDDELLEMVQEYTFRYFWDFAEPKSGMSHERTKSGHGNIITVGGSGFGVMAVIVGVERGFVTREQGVERLLKVIDFLKNTDRYHGMWSHWYSGETLKTFPFSKYDDGGDIVESSFMAQGLLTAFQYFDKNSANENKLREQIKYLWETMEWDFYTNKQDILFWHWSPNYGWKKQHGIRGYNECLITYVLAASSPSHAISAAAYHKGWMGKSANTFLNYQTFYNISLPLGPKRQLGGPLFFEHYSYLGLDPRGLSDKYANYWEQGRRHTLINRAYCIDNPKGYKGYGENFWGLTASDKVPKGYRAHAPGERDLGTIAPTAAISSMPYTPKESISTLKNFYRNYGQVLFGEYGFYDAINLSYEGTPDEQVRKNYIGIDQGPIIIMIENYRTGLLWKYFMKNTDLQNGLKKLGFKTK